jgi:hypothetical protein
MDPLSHVSWPVAAYQPIRAISALFDSNLLLSSPLLLFSIPPSRLKSHPNDYRDTMVNRGLIPILVTMMLVTGVCNTILNKYQVTRPPRSMARSVPS